jgi:hypothetical protein
MEIIGHNKEGDTAVILTKEELITIAAFMNFNSYDDVADVVTRYLEQEDTQSFLIDYKYAGEDAKLLCDGKSVSPDHTLFDSITTYIKGNN